MKVLIITYYWAPSGGSGVQRWLKFVKYLQEFDVKPIVYTVETKNHFIEDKTLLEEVSKEVEVIKKSIFEPNQILSFFGSKSKRQSIGFLSQKPSFFGKIIRFIRANYFIPDARKFWINPSVKFLKNYLSENPVDAIITTGPPHSLHLIGLKLKKKTGIAWVSDFRDLWTEIDYFHKLPLTKNSRKKHQKLEEEVLVNSNKVIVVGNTMKKNFLQYNKNITVITNGFDTSKKTGRETLDSDFTITHIGMMNSDRNPKNLWKVLKRLSDNNSDFEKHLKIRLIGKVSEEVKDELKKFDDNQIEYINYLEHNEVVKHQSSSQVLLLSINNVSSAKGIVTGKIFEYLQAKRPILAIGTEDGDAAIILKETNAGKIFEFDNEHGLKSHILNLFDNYKRKNFTLDSSNIQKYHRKELTKQLANLIKDLS